MQNAVRRGHRRRPLQPDAACPRNRKARVQLRLSPDQGQMGPVSMGEQRGRRVGGRRRRDARRGLSAGGQRRRHRRTAHLRDRGAGQVAAQTSFSFTLECRG